MHFGNGRYSKARSSGMLNSSKSIGQRGPGDKLPNINIKEVDTDEEKDSLSGAGRADSALSASRGCICGIFWHGRPENHRAAAQSRNGHRRIHGDGNPQVRGRNGRPGRADQHVVGKRSGSRDDGNGGKGRQLRRHRIRQCMGSKICRKRMGGAVGRVCHR